jgi:hypothetical protein
MARHALGRRRQSGVSSLQQLDMSIRKAVAEWDDRDVRPVSAGGRLRQNGDPRIDANEGQSGWHEICLVANVEEILKPSSIDECNPVK